MIIKCTELVLYVSKAESLDSKAMDIRNIEFSCYTHIDLDEIREMSLNELVSNVWHT